MMGLWISAPILEAVKPKERVISALNTKEPFAGMPLYIHAPVVKMNPRTLVHACQPMSIGGVC